jgi:hypothetical protein
MTPGSSPAGRLANGRATPGPARPCHRQPLAMAPSTRSSAPGSPWGSQSGVKGDGRARAKGHQPSQDQECRGPPSAPGNMPAGSGQPGNLRACRDGPLLELAGLAEAGGSHHEHQRLAQRTRAFGAGQHAVPGPWARARRSADAGTEMPSSVPTRLRRRATWDAALPRAGAAKFTLPRVTGG